MNLLRSMNSKDITQKLIEIKNKNGISEIIGDLRRNN